MVCEHQQAGCYVDLGRGPNTDLSFCNVDYSYKPGVDVCWDVTKTLSRCVRDRHFHDICLNTSRSRLRLAY